MKNSKLFSLFVITSSLLTSCKTYVNITASEPDAKIIVNGNNTATGNYKLLVEPYQCQIVNVEKSGYLSETRKYCRNVSGVPKPPVTDLISLAKDEAYDASIKSDIANVSFTTEVHKKYREEEAWKVIGQVITNYFDEIVTTSRETGYMLTAWKIQSFPQRTIRSRSIVKINSSNPLSYKVTLQSQIAYQAGVNAKDDEKFSDWDRILKRYTNFIDEFQSRLGDK